MAISFGVTSAYASGYVTVNYGVTTVLSGTLSIAVNLSGKLNNVSGSPKVVLLSVNTSGMNDKPYQPTNFNSGSFTVYGIANTSGDVVLSYVAAYYP